MFLFAKECCFIMLLRVGITVLTWQGSFMSLHLSKKSILKKTAQVGALTLLSRLLGIVREFLLTRFLGVGAVSDAFIAAFKLPNFFRHVFAEGALSASFVPVFIKTVKEGNRKEANGLMTISFLFFEGLVLALYLFVLLKTNWVLMILAPGFSAEQAAYAIPFLRILFSFLFFISSSALLGGALHSINHFFTPAFGTPLWNLIYVGTLILCVTFKLPVTFLCAGIIFGAFVQFCLHLIMFFRFNFSFGRIDAGVRALFGAILAKFLPCLLGVSIVELNLFIGTSIASFLPEGSTTLLYLASRFMNIPLGMFAAAFSNVMLTHFSRLVLYAPRRLNFYMLEVAKFVTWIIVPIMLFLMIVAFPLFGFLLASKAMPGQVNQGGIILIFYSSGLIFSCFNKIVLSMFYALKDTKATTIAAAACALVNIAGDVTSLWLGGSYGIAFANTLASACMTGLCILFLYKRHGIVFYGGAYAQFLWRFMLQLFFVCLTVASLGLILYQFLSYSGHVFLFQGKWFLCVATMGLGLVMGLMFLTKQRFGLNIYFLERH